MGRVAQPQRRVYHHTMLKLFYAPGTCALASHIALECAGAGYEAVRIDFGKQEQRSPEYLGINPKGRVPALLTDRGVITETPAVLQYIAQTHPQAKLAPLDDPYLLGKVNEFNSYLCSTVHVNHAHKRRGSRWADDEQAQAAMAAKVTQNMADCFDLIEREMLRGPWVLGEQFSICDPYLFTLAGWLKGHGIDVAQYPKVGAHYARIQADERVKKVLAQQAA
jgi:glutathione S-transferase